MKKYSGVALNVIVFVFLFIFLRIFSEYHFYCVEQNQLFQLTPIFIIDKLMQPGGLAMVLSGCLVQTNLIYGAYPVAEKYIAVLENTFYYKDWAKAQQKFLYNDEAVEADPLLGNMRRNLLSENHLSQIDGFDTDLIRLAEQNPSNKAAFHYAGVFYLLAKDVTRFKTLVETYYGTDLLPSLPVSFQEAIIILSEKDPDYWKRFGVSESIVGRFTDYKRQVLAGRNNSNALPGLMYRSYGDTYWYYYMFK